MSHKTISKTGLAKKTYTITFDAISSEMYESKKMETIEEIKAKGLSIDEENAAIDEINAEPIPQKTLKCVIQDPQFKELSLALGAMMTVSGQIDIVNAGKIIFDTCCIEYDAELEANPKALIKICMELATDYVIPITAEIKKN
jgi:hypothetical protein